MSRMLHRVSAATASAAVLLLLTPAVEALDVSTNDVVFGAIEGGQPTTIRFTGPSALQVLQDTELFATVRGPGDVRLSVSNAVLRFSGRLEAADHPETAAYISLRDGAHFDVSEHARINQQLPDGIQSRRIYVTGQGTNETMELAADFLADRSAYPDLGQWKADGFSALYAQDVHLVTHSSGSLPVMHKRAADGTHVYQGAIHFWKGRQSRWTVATAHQVYAGVLSWSGELELRTEKNLLCTGSYAEHAPAYVGSHSGAPARLRKTGSGTLAFMGAQAYARGAEVVVEEGTLAFYSDPGDPGEALRRLRARDRIGPHLELKVAVAGTAEFQVPRPVTLQSIDCDGTLRLLGVPAYGVPRMLVRGDLTLGPEAYLVIPAVSSGNDGFPPAPLEIGGRATLDGRLRFPPDWTPAAGRYRLIAAKGGISGEWQLPALPDHLTLSMEDGVLVVSAKPMPEPEAEPAPAPGNVKMEPMVPPTGGAADETTVVAPPVAATEE